MIVINRSNRRIIDKLERELPSREELTLLIEGHTGEDMDYAAKAARRITDRVYGRRVFVRGLIEVSSFCRNDCYYCGIRRSNRSCQRYRLTKEQILDCCDEGAELGFHTFVLQGGEDMSFSCDDICDTVRSIKNRHRDCAVTLSIGEKSFEEYRAYREAGADRYLLRHETADREHYSKLHPESMSLDSRKRCLSQLKELGFQTGAGMMVGSPFQTAGELAEDMRYLYELKPQMVGMGPFIPHKDTPFRNEPAGSAELTVFLISLVRIMLPFALLPATTALGTISAKGRELAIYAGANVIMPNLSPESVKPKYSLYDGKLSAGSESAGNVGDMEKRLEALGFSIDYSRGDCIEQ